MGQETPGPTGGLSEDDKHKPFQLVIANLAIYPVSPRMQQPKRQGSIPSRIRLVSPGALWPT